MTRKRFSILHLVIMVLLMPVVSAFVRPAYASFVQQVDIPTFDTWLAAASGPLVSAIVGFLLSWVVEWWPAYNNWPSRSKRLVYFALCLVVPVGAACLRAALGYVPWSFDPLIWHAIWNGFVAGGVGTIAHTRKLAGKKVYQVYVPKDKPYDVQRQL